MSRKMSSSNAGSFSTQEADPLRDNKSVFAKYGVAVPKTWQEYVVAARKLHAANPKVYIANDTGDAGFTTSMIWQAGGKPFQVSGQNVKVNLQDAGSQQFAKMWNTLISEHLLAPVGSWSDQWYTGLGNGSIASLAIGAWMPANLESGVASGAGKWAVAPLPQWQSTGATASSENGGSSLAVPAASQQKALAYGFMKYADVQDGVKARVDGGAFPATTAELTSSAFLNKDFAYFGGQKVNQVLSQSAKDVVPGWSYLPYQVYANSVFKDTVGQAYTGKTDLTSGLKAWQDTLVTYGNQQGFSVNK
jgi:multiple sugar transport system substrate-binding protein